MINYPELNSLIQDIDTQLESVAGSIDPASLGTTSEPMSKYILVEIGPRSLAIMIDSLAEVGSVPDITFLPNLPEWVKGIMNIRSEIVSMVDFAGFLNEEQVHTRREKKLVVLRNGKMKVGVGVDSIVGTVTRGASDIQSSKENTDSSIGKALFMENLLVDGETYAILNVQRFLTHPRLVNFAKESVR